VQVAAPPILKEAGGIHPSILPSLHRLAPLPVSDDSSPSQPGSSGNGALANVAFDLALRDNVPSIRAAVTRRHTDVDESLSAHGHFENKSVSIEVRYGLM
jgi:hypothetical protein